MNREQLTETADRIIQIRTRMIKSAPFFAHLAMSLKIACAKIGTASTDGRRLIVDPVFVKKLNDRELEFIILHETLHCVLGHISRGENCLHGLYNVAADTVVNSMIMEMWNVGSNFKVAGQPPVHLAPNGKEGHLFSAEEIYLMLLNNTEAADALSNVCAAPDCHDYWPKSPDQIEKILHLWSSRIAQASDIGYSESTFLPPAVRDIITHVTDQQKTDWRRILHEFLYHDVFDYSYAYPDRRFTDSDFIIPAYRITDDGHIKTIWLCIDTSGSISDQELSCFLGYALDMIHQTNMTGMVSFFDSRVSDPVPFEDESERMEMKPVGGGGTSFRNIFRYLEEYMYPDHLPKAILIFTDGYSVCPDESAAMGIPVFWLITKGGRTDLPFGTVVELNQDQ